MFRWFVNRVANEVATLLQRGERAAITEALGEIRATSAETTREARQLIADMEDVLEKYQRALARIAMRRTREIRSQLEEAPEQPAQVEPSRELTPAELKQALRDRVATGGMMRRA